jgi:hypothetical protein
VPEGVTGNPIPGGYKYGILVLQVGGISGETVKFGPEFYIDKGSGVMTYMPAYPDIE